MTSLTRNEGRAIGLALVVKAAVVLAISLSFYLYAEGGNVPNLWNRWYTGLDDLSSWYIPFANWDGQYYLLLSDWGYNYVETPDSPRAFFPLYPLLIRAMSYVMPRMAAAALLSWLSTAGFCYFLYRIGSHLGSRSPHLAVLITLAFPTAYYASVFYTEGLFLFLQMGFVYHFLVTKSRRTWIYAVLLPLTRGTALFIAAGVVAHMLFEYFQLVRSNKQAERTRKGSRTRNRNRLRGQGKWVYRSAAVESVTFNWNYYLSIFAAFFVGGVLYLAFFGLVTGDPLAGVAGQRTFEVNSISNLLNPGHFVSYLLSETTSWLGARDNLFNKLFVIASLVCCTVLVVWKEWALLCFYLPLVYGQAAMGIGVSFPRFLWVAVPFLALAIARNTSRSLPVYVMCAAAFVFQLYLLRQFSLNAWIA